MSSLSALPVVQLALRHVPIILATEYGTHAERRKRWRRAKNGSLWMAVNRTKLITPLTMNKLASGDCTTKMVGWSESGHRNTFNLISRQFVLTPQHHLSASPACPPWSALPKTAFPADLSQWHWNHAPPTSSLIQRQLGLERRRGGGKLDISAKLLPSHGQKSIIVGWIAVEIPLEYYFNAIILEQWSLCNRLE